jgi:hypothetical protein
MSWPSWMPIAARPATWIDWSTIFRSVIPREWPKRLFVAGSQAYADLVAFGEALALARDMLSVLQHNIWPAEDGNHWLFTDRWEEVFGIQPSGSLDQRTSRLIAFMRQRGTMTEDLLKAIMCRAFATHNPADIGINSPTPAAYAASGAVDEWQWAFLGHNMHIYSTSNAAIDRGLAEDLIRKITPTWELWSAGTYNELIWGTPGEEGAWDQATWG